MPNTRITKEKWKDHYSYAKKIYILGFLLAAALGSLVFSVTRYTPPAERSVQIQLVDSYVDTSKLEELEPVLLSQAQEYDPTLEEVSFLSIAYSGDGATDYYGAQAYMVQVYAGGNDIYFVNDMLLKDLIQQGYCAQLETLDGYEEFMRAHPGVTPIWRDEPSETPADEDDEPDEDAPPPVQHVYALDASSMQGFITRNAYSVRDKFALITSTSTNIDTSMRVLGLLYDHLTEDTPVSTPSEAAQ